MVVVGADVHKRTHTFVAVDEVGRKIGEKTVKAVTAGHGEAVMWVRERFGAEVVWAIEDCRHLSARFERDLMGFGQSVVRVPPKLMAQVRASARTRGKSDPIDALAVARGFLREPDLPLACHDEVSRELKLLVDRREVLVAQRTATINRLLWRVHELDPERAPKSRSLDLAKHRRILGDWLATVPGLVAELARDELADITRLTEAINALAKRIGQRVRGVAPVLLSLPGCGELTAAKLVGETAGVTRFKSAAAFARHARVAPVPVWSGNTADLWQEAFADVHQQVLNSDWQGQAGAAEQERAWADMTKVGTATDCMRETATNARIEAANLNAAQRRVLYAIEYAEAASFNVGEDFSVTDGQTGGTPAARATRQAQAQRFAADIRHRVIELTGLQQQVAGKLTGAAAGIRSLKFDESPMPGIDGPMGGGDVPLGPITWCIQPGGASGKWRCSVLYPDLQVGIYWSPTDDSGGSLP